MMTHRPLFTRTYIPSEAEVMLDSPSVATRNGFLIDVAEHVGQFFVIQSYPVSTTTEGDITREN